MRHFFRAIWGGGETKMAKAEKRPSQDFIKNRFSDENNQM